MTKVFEIFYTTTQDHYGQEFSGSLTREAENENEAESDALYELDKMYPEGSNSVDKIKDITWLMKK